MPAPQAYLGPYGTDEFGLLGEVGDVGCVVGFGVEGDVRAVAAEDGDAGFEIGGVRGPADGVVLVGGG